MLKWTLIVLAALVGLVVLLAVVGYFLPKSHVASRTVTVSASPEQVFAKVSDLTWFTSDVPVRIEVSEPPSRLVTRIADPTLPFGGTWTFALAPDGRGTRLTITEDGEVYNPIVRTLQKLFFSPYKTMDTYIAALRQNLGG
jgi:hypothetical protein